MTRPAGRDEEGFKLPRVESRRARRLATFQLRGIPNQSAPGRRNVTNLCLIGYILQRVFGYSPEYIGYTYILGVPMALLENVEYALCRYPVTCSSITVDSQTWYPDTLGCIPYYPKP